MDYGSINRFGIAAALTLLPAGASAIPVGLYNCRVEAATLTTASGERKFLTSAPAEFDLYAFARAGDSPALLHDRRQLNYQPVGEMAPVASVTERLFLDPATDLISTDGILYAQGGIEFRFTEKMEFTATGLASFDGSGEGVAVYEGVCGQQ